MANLSHLRPLVWPRPWTRTELKLLSGTAFDCIVIAEDAPPENAPQLEAAAREAGLGVVRTKDGQPPGVTIVEDGVWAKIGRSRNDPEAAEAGPTGLPWIDSNGWRIRLARARTGGKTPWVRFAPPEKEILSAGAWQIALADCEANGGRWLLALDEPLSRGIAAGNGAARKTWEALLQTAAFFREQPPEPADAGSGALLGVLSDFAGDNQFLGDEFLNLIAREYVPVRILLKTAPPVPLAGLRMVAYLDAQPLPAAWKTALAAFVDGGGTLLTARTAAPGIGVAARSVAGLEYEIRHAGRGRVAVATAGFDDPWRVAADAHVLLGRSHDLIRQANAGAMNITFSASPDGRRARLQLVNYALERAINPATLTLLHRYRSARFRSCANPAAAEVPVAVEYGRTAVYLPHFFICGTVDLQA